MSTWGRARLRAQRKVWKWRGHSDMRVRIQGRMVCERLNRAEHHAALSERRYCPLCEAAMR